jgi:hypothetical protein
MFMYPEEIDRRLNWPLGMAARLARRKRLPHVILPDGSLRFLWADVAALLHQVQAERPAAGGSTGAPPARPGEPPRRPGSQEGQVI